MSEQWPFKHMFCYPISGGFGNEEKYIKRFNAYHGQDSGGNRMFVSDYLLVSQIVISFKKIS